jgi:CheY-like chemotaxis protein
LATLRQRTPSADRVTGAAAAIFDASNLSQDESADLKQLAAALTPAPVIALLAFPRAEDYRRALSAGAVAVLSKPLAVEDLFWQIDAAAAAG